MKRTIIYFLLCSLALLSFTTKETRLATAGTYGVCGESIAYLSLQLNTDGSFLYTDGTVSSKKLSVSGTWDQSGSVIRLHDYKTERAIHTKWKVDGEKCIKSRKGMEWRRLCRIN